MVSGRAHLLVAACLFLCSSVSALWTKYALVSDNPDAPGSKFHIPFSKISPSTVPGLQLNATYFFGSSVANMGDMNGDGIDDIAVGSMGEPCEYHGITQVSCGAVYIMFMADNTTVKSFVRIGANESSGLILMQQSLFGYAMANIGDLDGDGVNDIVVGAPGTPIPTVFILYLQSTGEVKKVVFVRGRFLSQAGSLSQNTSGPCITDDYCPNGPPVTYLSYFGSMIAPLGDYNNDGVLDFAVGASDASGGGSRLYFLYMYRNGTVKYYSTLAAGYNGAPSFDKTFVNFGSSFAIIGDLDGDGVNETLIGAKDDDDNVVAKSGSVFVCFMNPDGSIKSYKRLSQLQTEGAVWPSLVGDECGAAVVATGDINLDNMRQQHPTRVKTNPTRRSIPDFIMGCPQSATGGGTGTVGKFMMMFMGADGNMVKYHVFPETADAGSYNSAKKHNANNLGFVPNAGSALGASLAIYPDYMETGIHGIVVGAPGDNEGGGDNAGAVYILYFRRLQYHRAMPCTACFYGIRLGAAAMTAFVCFGGCGLFFYIFRRRPDEVEIAVKKAGLERKQNWERKRQDFNNGGKVYADSYEV